VSFERTVILKLVFWEDQEIRHCNSPGVMRLMHELILDFRTLILDLNDLIKYTFHQLMNPMPFTHKSSVWKTLL